MGMLKHIPISAKQEAHASSNNAMVQLENIPHVDLLSEQASNNRDTN